MENFKNAYFIELIHFCACVCETRVPAAPKFTDGLGGFRGLNVESYSQVSFTPAKGYRAEAAKGKGAKLGGEGSRAHGQSSLPVESLRTQQVLTTHGKQDSPRKLIGDIAPRVYIGCWSCGQPLPSTYQTSRLPEGKQGFSLKHIALKKILGTVNHSPRVGIGGHSPKIQVSGCQPKTSHATGLSSSSSLSL